MWTILWLYVWTCSCGKFHTINLCKQSSQRGQTIPESECYRRPPCLSSYLDAYNWWRTVSTIQGQQQTRTCCCCHQGQPNYQPNLFSCHNFFTLCAFLLWRWISCLTPVVFIGDQVFIMFNGVLTPSVYWKRHLTEEIWNAILNTNKIISV